MAKQTKSDAIRMRVTPQTKMKIDRQVARGAFKNRSDLYSTAVNLLVNDPSGVFADVSRHFSENYVIFDGDQYVQVKNAYSALQEALHALTVLTDDYEKGAPNHYKNLLRDYLLPRLYDTLKQYEDSHEVISSFRVTD